MNKYQRAEIKKIIQAQIDSLAEELSAPGKDPGEAPGDTLRLPRLETALMRIDAGNFGDCFKCETTIPMSRLRILPETTICPACLEGPTD